MKIASIKVWDFSPVYRDGPYAMSHVTSDVAHGRQIMVKMADGLAGFGEMVFAPSIPPDQLAERIADEPTVLDLLIGSDVSDLGAVAATLAARGKSWRGMAFGLETAMLDYQTRVAGLPLSDVLGGTQADSVNDYFSISERTTEKIEDRLRIAGADRAVIQLKLGVGTRADDAAHVRAALTAMSANQTLLADANGGWTIEEALAMAAQFDDPRITWEEPCKTYADNVTVAQHVSAPVMVDQCVGDAAVAEQAIQDQSVQSLCIKPAFLGGLTPARRIRDLAAAAGMKMRIDGPFCGDIASAAILHVALGAPPDLLIAGCDLREPLVIELDLHGVVAKPGARIAPPIGIGLGMDITESSLGSPARVFPT